MSSSTYVAGMERLLRVVQELSMARSLEAVQVIVRTAARELTGSDGATFVLRDNGKCYYADEDAISPLWKGMRFPLEACISGWSMLHREQVVIGDIYADQRIPHDAYRPTFVKSLCMTPIRRIDPIGSIGTYWATNYKPTDEQLSLLGALADATSVAMENVELVRTLESRVEERTAQLSNANEELEAYNSAVSHDLRAPLRAIAAFSSQLREDYGEAIPAEAIALLGKIEGASGRMKSLVDDLLTLSKVSRGILQRTNVDLSQMSADIITDLRRGDEAREVTVVIDPGISVEGDRNLLRIAFENLLGNAWKYTRKNPHAHITVTRRTDGVITIADDGAGFDPRHAEKLFTPFQRLHRADEFEGTGIGLATVARIVRRHGGTIGATAEPGKGATFAISL